MNTEIRSRASDHALLMVDDDYDDFILTRRAFQSVCTVKEFSCAQSGRALFEHLERLSDSDDHVMPSIILLDINMPEEDGLTVLRRLRDMSKFRHIPVVILSTSSSESDVTAAYQSGANSFLSKPSTLAELKEVAARFSEYWFNITRLPPLH